MSTRLSGETNPRREEKSTGQPLAQDTVEGLPGVKKGSSAFSFSSSFAV
jgi:hypothetical protein